MIDDTTKYESPRMTARQFELLEGRRRISRLAREIGETAYEFGLLVRGLDAEYIAERVKACLADDYSSEAEGVGDE